MRNVKYIAAGLSMLFAAASFAGEADHTALMLAKIKQNSAPSNVQEVALRKLAFQCEENLRNPGFRSMSDDNQTNYIVACLKHNQAREAYEKYSQKQGI